MTILKDRMGRELSSQEAARKVVGRLYSFIIDLELLILRVAGLVPIHTFRWLIYRAAGINIPFDSHIHMGAQFFYPAGIEIGHDTIIGQGAFLDGRDKLKIGDHVDIASEVMIYNSEHDVHSEDFKATVSPVEVEDYAFIGPRAIILPGVKIGYGSVVAAGAVVTEDVKERTIVGGVPAKAIGQREQDLHYRLGRARNFQ